MKPWKVMAGVGAACAACCALPLAAGIASLSAFGVAVWRCSGEWVPAAVVLLAGVLGAWAWRRRRSNARRCRCGGIGCGPTTMPR